MEEMMRGELGNDHKDEDDIVAVAVKGGLFQDCPVVVDGRSYGVVCFPLFLFFSGNRPLYCLPTD